MHHEDSSQPDSAGQPAPPMANGRWQALAVGALVLLAVLAYANAVPHPFVYDDNPLVLKNAQIRSLDNVPAMIGFHEDGFRLTTRWTRNVTHALEYAVAGPWAPLYHGTNVALHALVGILVFLLAGRMSGNRWLGWWAAALFLVHPVNTEVVAHVAGRRGLLAALFSLAALVLFQGYTRRGGFWRLGLGAFSVYLAVFSKELAIMTPVAFVVVDLYTRFHSPEAAAEAREGRRLPWLREVGRHLWERRFLYGGLAVLTLALGLGILFLSAEVSIQGSRGFYDTTGEGLGVFQRAAIAGLGLRLLLFPVGQTVDYSYDALGLAGGDPSIGLFEVLLLSVAMGLAVWGLMRRNWAGFVGVWCLLFYLPHTGIIPWHEYFAERFLYLSSIGFCIGIAAVGVSLARATRWDRSLAALGAVILAALTAGTVLQNEVWASPAALWTNAVEQYPNTARAHKALADTYLADARPDRALEHFREAARILPAYSEARVGIAVALTARREYAAALEVLEGILDQWPSMATALNTKAYIHQTLGDPERALETYHRAVEANPKFADGYNNLARLYVEQGDLDTAVTMYEKALEHNPALLPALLNLATVYREGFEDEERAEFYEQKAKQLQDLQ